MRFSSDKNYDSSLIKAEISNLLKFYREKVKSQKELAQKDLVIFKNLKSFYDKDEALKSFRDNRVIFSNKIQSFSEKKDYTAAEMINIVNILSKIYPPELSLREKYINDFNIWLNTEKQDKKINNGIFTGMQDVILDIYYPLEETICYCAVNEIVALDNLIETNKDIPYDQESEAD